MSGQKDDVINLPNQRTEKEWTNYLATAFAEGFCEGENASEIEELEAWACLIKTGMCWSLQGWFGRNAMMLIEDGIVSEDGLINWDFVDISLN